MKTLWIERRKTSKSVYKALLQLESEHKIIDVLGMGNFSSRNLLNPYDLYITYIKGGARIFTAVAIIGPKFAQKHRRIHPDIPFLVVKRGNNPEKIKKKILQILEF